jgi:YegS/Rv2252/BmrU family lipid kinase
MADPARPLAVLVNPAAAGGRALRALPTVEAELERLGVDFRVEQTTSADHGRELAAAASAAGDAVAALGGDGFVGMVAGALCGSEVPLTVLPGGRGNDFARVLGIPADPAKATRMAVEGVERLVDVAEANGVTYVGIASCGFDSDANRIANEATRVKGDLVYLYAALRALWEWRPATFQVSVDGEQHAFTGLSAAVANSKAYGGGMYAVPQAQLDDGLLDVMLCSNRPKLAVVKGLQEAFSGAHVDDARNHFVRGREVEINADRPFTVYADGDPIAELPVKICVAERVLRVMVPAA